MRWCWHFYFCFKSTLAVKQLANKIFFTTNKVAWVSNKYEPNRSNALLSAFYSEQKTQKTHTQKQRKADCFTASKWAVTSVWCRRGNLFLFKPLQLTMLLQLPPGLDINVKDGLLSKSIGWPSTETKAAAGTVFPPYSVFLLFYLCNMCFGLGPEEGSAAITRLWVRPNFITCQLQCQGR